MNCFERQRREVLSVTVVHGSRCFSVIEGKQLKHVYSIKLCRTITAHNTNQLKISFKIYKLTFSARADLIYNLQLETKPLIVFSNHNFK